MQYNVEIDKILNPKSYDCDEKQDCDHVMTNPLDGCTYPIRTKWNKILIAIILEEQAKEDRQIEKSK